MTLDAQTFSPFLLIWFRYQQGYHFLSSLRPNSFWSAAKTCGLVMPLRIKSRDREETVTFSVLGVTIFLSSSFRTASFLGSTLSAFLPLPRLGFLGSAFFIWRSATFEVAWPFPILSTLAFFTSGAGSSFFTSCDCTNWLNSVSLGSSLTVAEAGW